MVIEKARTPLAIQTLDPNDVDALKEFVRKHLKPSQALDACIVGATGILSQSLRSLIHDLSDGHEIFVDDTTPLPILNCYATPTTLGPDRLAAAVGGWFEGDCKHPVLIIDAGTAITYDFVTEDGWFIGGNISAGLHLRLNSLHKHTARLPLVSPSEQTSQYLSNIEYFNRTENPLSVIGNNTTHALVKGALLGIRYEMEGYIREFLLKYPNIIIILTGGTQIVFEKTLKNRTFARPYLVIEGLYLILRHVLLNTKQ